MFGSWMGDTRIYCQQILGKHIFRTIDFFGCLANFQTKIVQCPTVSGLFYRWIHCNTMQHVSENVRCPCMAIWAGKIVGLQSLLIKCWVWRCGYLFFQIICVHLSPIPSKCLWNMGKETFQVSGAVPQKWVDFLCCLFVFFHYHEILRYHIDNSNM